MDLNRRTWMTGAATLPLWISCPSLANAQIASLPRKMTVVCTFSVGSGPDVVARAIAGYAASQLGIQMSVLNQPEVHGETALAQFISKPADPTMWLMAEDTVLAVNPHLYPRPNPSPLHGLVPLAQTGSNFFLLMVRASDPMQTVADFVQEVKLTGKPMNFSSGGVGSKHQLYMLDLAQRLGVHMNHVAYQGGGQAAAGLARGEVRVTLAGASALPLVKAGKLRILAIAAPQRSERFPGIPCLAETFPDFSGVAWFGWFGRTGTSSSLVAGMQALLQQAMADADVQRTLAAKGGLDASYASGAVLATQVQQETQRFAKLTALLHTTSKS